MSSATLASLYPQHIDTLLARSAEALQRGGFDHLLIPSGTLHYQAFDDRDTRTRSIRNSKRGCR